MTTTEKKIRRLLIMLEIHKIIDTKIGIMVVTKSLHGTLVKLNGIIIIGPQAIIVGITQKIRMILHRVGIPQNLHGKQAHHKISNL